MTPREELAVLLCNARKAAGYRSQAAYARSVPCSRPLISRTESAKAPVPSADVLAGYIDIGADATEIKRLIDAMQSGTPEWFMPYKRAETAADAIRCWSPMLMPGILQIPSYAYELFRAAGDDTDAAKAKVAARLERQTILDRAEPTHLVVVLGEHVLRWLIGSPKDMAEQLAHLASMAERTHISVHILPATGANAGLSGAFDLASAEGVDTLRMDGIADVVTVNRALVRRANIVFDLVRRDALPRIPSRDMILEAEEQWKTRI